MSQSREHPSSQRGFTLVELMVALVLGLIVIGGVTSVFLSNQQSYRSNQAMGEVQDNSRIAFEFMARDLRNAGLTGCGNAGRISNVLKNGPVAGGTDWWANWDNAIHGYDNGVGDPAVTTGAALGERVAGTDSIELIGATGAGWSVNLHSASASPPTIQLNEASSSLQAGDVLVVCDPDHATLVQATGYTSATSTLQYNTGTNSPGNCSKGLGFPTVCTATGTTYTFGQNSQIAELNAADWYIGNNSVGGTSLYRIGLVTTSATTTSAPVAQELVRNVTDMQIRYLADGNTDYVTAASVINWSTVTAVQITLTLQSTNQHAATDMQPIKRTFTDTVTLRNRVN
jgi:type IV pilus assembly protein PilW